MPFDTCSRAFGDGVYRERLRELCRVIDGVSDRNFDLKDWSRNGFCTTVSCAVGWAMKDAWFQRQGLRRIDGSPAYGGYTGWAAVRQFFGLSQQEALDLFHAGRYERATRVAVRARILGHIEEAAERQPEPR